MPNQIIKISNDEFSKMRLINNSVAIEITHRNSEDKTKSGLIIVQDPAMFVAHSIESAENYNTSQHLDRWGVVAKLPERLVYARHNRMFGMDWDTDIEIQVGDLVWADYYNLHHCPIFKTEDKEYWIISYDCLIVAKRWKYTFIEGYDPVTFKPKSRKEEYNIIPLNGYCLFEQVNEGLQSKFLELPKEINKSKGIVKYTGSRNREYTKTWNSKEQMNIPSKWFDDVEINPGDEVVFRTQSECLLEDAQHRFFEDTDLRYEQRKNVLAVRTK